MGYYSSVNFFFQSQQLSRGDTLQVSEVADVNNTELPPIEDSTDTDMQNENMLANSANETFSTTTNAGPVSVDNFDNLKKAIAIFNQNDTDLTISVEDSITVEEVLEIGDEGVLTIQATSAGSLIRDESVYKGSMFKVSTAASLVLKNIILDGKNVADSEPLVDVLGGKLTIGEDAILKNSSMSDKSKKYFGAAIFVKDGALEMNGGTISNNSAYAEGGIHIDNSEFILNDGLITGNTGSAGGGVGIWSGSTFSMRGGEITDN